MSYIKTELALEACCEGCNVKFGDQPCEPSECEIRRLIRAVPAADAKPVVRGKWTLNKDGSGTCSECGRTQKQCWDLDNWDNFCHFCGADMRLIPNGGTE